MQQVTSSPSLGSFSKAGGWGYDVERRQGLLVGVFFVVAFFQYVFTYRETESHRLKLITMFRHKVHGHFQIEFSVFRYEVHSRVRNAKSITPVIFICNAFHVFIPPHISGVIWLKKLTDVLRFATEI